MTCESFKRELDAMENYNPSAEMNKHMSSCPACALGYASLRSALTVYTLPLSVCERDLVPGIMAALPFARRPRRFMSLRNWLLGGVALLVSIAFVPFLEEFKALTRSYGNGFLLPLGIVLGILVTVYMMVFIATHVQDFSRRFGIRRN
jgi:hypothetical protein